MPLIVYFNKKYGCLSIAVTYTLNRMEEMIKAESKETNEMKRNGLEWNEMKRKGILPKVEEGLNKT